MSQEGGGFKVKSAANWQSSKGFGPMEPNFLLEI